MVAARGLVSFYSTALDILQMTTYVSSLPGILDWPARAYNATYSRSLFERGMRTEGAGKIQYCVAIRRHENDSAC